MVRRRGGAAALVLALGLAIPLVVGGGLAVVAMTRSPLLSDVQPEPVVAAVERAERVDSQATTVQWLPAATFDVKSQSSGTITSLSITPGTPLADGDVAMTVDQLPVVAYNAPAPLFRDIAAGAEGQDVLTAERLLVALGHLRQADTIARADTTRAISAFNASHGRAREGTLAVATLLWVPQGSGAPQSLHVRVGDVVAPQTPLYSTATSGDQITVSTSASDVERVLTVAGVAAPLPAGATAVSAPADVAALRSAMAGQPTLAATLAATTPRTVGTVPASAVVTDGSGRACFFPSVSGAPVPIDTESGSYGLVDVSADLIGEPVLSDPRRVRTDLSCG